MNRMNLRRSAAQETDRPLGRLDLVGGAGAFHGQHHPPLPHQGKRVFGEPVERPDGAGHGYIESLTLRRSADLFSALVAHLDMAQAQL